MKCFVTLLSFCCWSISIHAQQGNIVYNSNVKKTVEAKDIREWEKLWQYDMSSNGEFVFYVIRNFYSPKKDKSVIESLKGNWKKEYSENLPDRRFSKDSKYFYYLKGKDSLGIQRLGSEERHVINNVQAFESYSWENTNFLIVKRTGGDKKLTIRNVAVSKDVDFSDVEQYLIGKDANLILIQSYPGLGTSKISQIDLFTGLATLVWEGAKIRGLTFNNRKDHIAFIEREKSIVSIRLSDKVAQSTPVFQNDTTWSISKIETFNPEENVVYFSANKKAESKKANPNMASLNIWSYTDTVVQAGQLLTASNAIENYYFSINFNNNRITPLTEGKDGLISTFNNNSEFFLVQENYLVRSDEWHWNSGIKRNYKVISKKDGIVKYQLSQLETIRPIFSPNGDYLIYFNPTIQGYVSLELSSGKSKNLTEGIRTIWTSYIRNDDGMTPFTPIWIGGWSEDGTLVYIYDQHDIHCFDLAGKGKPINITHGLGQNQNIAFRFMTNRRELAVVKSDSKLIINAFDRKTKQEGFYLADFRKNGAFPQKMTMQDKVFCGTDEQSEPSGRAPIAADDSALFLVRSESSLESPNLYTTTDFITFKPVTDIHPEKRFNWLTSELIKWKTKDGSMSEGILYKPENFNESKKYPLIILYYEQLSAGLNQFQLIPSGGADIDIPTFVSNGYLVFVADIHYKIGNPGASALNSVESAAKHLSTYSWVDGKRIGINGHSFGGYQTQYIVTHSNLFVAACANAGWSNFISASNRLRSWGGTSGHYYEMFRQRMGTHMWERPDLYIKSSPIFQAHRITSPLLMMNNQNDNDVIIQEGIQFYLALRRLGKKVWMLDYDNEGHGVRGEKALNDFDKRMMQFFDHYLKDAPAPKWMLYGIPAKLKGIEDGFELDTSGKVPGPGLLSPANQKKMDSLRHRKPVTVTIQ